MEQQSSPDRSVRFATFDLDLQSGELHKNGRKVRLPHQSFQVLARLLEQPGEVVSRDELRHLLWPDGTFVDFKVGLSSAVKKLRDALGDSAENPRFVETVPRFGYRFIAPVNNGAGHTPGISTARVTTEPSTISVRPPRPARRVRVAFTAVALVALAGVFTFRARDRIFGFAHPIHSLAVLPLENLTGDPGQQYFADGLTDALTTVLAEATDFQVTARSSTVAYKTLKKPLRVVGGELHVDALVEGAFVRSGDHVRVSAHLIDARTEEQLWAHDFDGRLGDLVALQEDVAHAIARAAVGSVKGRPPARKVSARAEELFLRSVAAAGRDNIQGFAEAIKYADAATDEQPDFAEAWARKAVWWTQYTFGGGLAPLEYMPKAEAAAQRALQFDDAVAEAHLALALVLYRFHWNWAGAERELRRGLQLNPSANAHRMLAAFLAAGGHPTDAVEEAQRARDLDPLSANALFNLAVAHRDAGRKEEAMSELRTLARERPDMARAHVQLAVSLLADGDSASAVDEVKAAVNLSHRASGFLADLGYTYAVVGERAEAQEILGELEAMSRRQFVSPVDLAAVQLGLGRKDEAFKSLDEACEVRDPLVVRLLTDERMASLRSDPRFQDVLRRVGLIR